MAGEIVISEKPGDTLKKWRNIFKLSQKNLASLLNVKPSVVCDFEKGRRASPGIGTVRKFVETSARLLGMKIQWRGRKLNERGIDKKTGKTIIKIDKRFFRPAEVDVLHGDYSRARKILKWEPKTSFNELVEMMTISDYNEQKKISNNLNNS